MRRLFSKGTEGMKDQFELLIDDISTAGEGIGHKDGRAVFVPGVLPGDRILAEMAEGKGNLLKAECIELLEPSVSRVSDDCPNGKDCGGCSLREYKYEAQLDWKKAYVNSVLTRIAGLENPKINPIVGMDDPYSYRNKVEYAVSTKGGNIEVGFYGRGSHEICDCEGCLISFEDAQAAAQVFLENPIKGVKQLTVRKGRTGESMVILHSDKKKLSGVENLVYALDDVMEDLESVVWVDGFKATTLAGKPTIEDYIETDMATIKVEVGPLSFYQVNPIQTSRLYSIAQKYANLTGSETVLDLYCGAGSIGLTMAGNCSRVIGVESVKPAVLEANRNAVINGIVNAEFICGKAEEVVAARLQGVKADVVILDPPRSGCKPELLDTVAEIAPKRIVYVSCGPATLARDIKILCEKGYEFVEATPVDMFPFSTHCEVVTLLSKRNRKADSSIKLSLDMDEYYEIVDKEASDGK